MSVQVKVSKYCEGVNGSHNCFEKGDKAVIGNAINPEDNGLEVLIDSEMMLHKDAPMSGKVYEVIFSNGYGRVAISAHKLFPIIDTSHQTVSSEPVPPTS